jgi:hypothetical protein
VLDFNQEVKMQAKPESRSTTREKVRSLAKFQMLRLINRRTARANQDHWSARELTRAETHREEPTRDPMQEPTHLAPGLPGCRLQAGHAGLDPIENLTEAAFVYGRFIRDLFTGKLRTHNPIWLIAMAVAGIGLFAPFAILAQFAWATGEIGAMVFALFLFPLALAAIALWMNFIRNLQTPHHA